MRAVVRSGGRTQVSEAPDCVRPPGWVRLRTLLAGICRTDLYAAQGVLPVTEPRILGHEVVGEVEEADAGSALAVGTRVTVAPLISCGSCPSCGRGARCLRPRMLGIDVDGAFAEHLVVPEACVFRVPSSLSLKQAAYIEPIAASLAVLRAPIAPQQRGVVLGAGRIATLTTRILHMKGFRDVVQLDDLDASDEGTYDFAIETGAPFLAAAVRAVRPGGVVVLKSRPARPVPLDVARAVQKEITLAATAYGSFPEAIALALELPMDDLLGDIYPLDQFATAFERAADSPKLFLSPAGEG